MLLALGKDEDAEAHYHIGRPITEWYKLCIPMDERTYILYT